ncbi:MAG: acyltransferase [Oscillospiraceae bacterium]|nr:acyltransferase [Oscillospiraceae bacterium]
MIDQSIESQGNKGCSKHRIVYLDFLRLISAFFVIVNHTNSRVFLNSELSLTWYASIAYFFASKIAVPVFLMITGAVSMNREPTWNGYRRRVWRAVVVLIAANVFYYLYSVWRTPNASIEADKLVEAIFQSGARPLWYLHVYVICTLFMPFFQKFASVLTQREERLFLLLSVGLNGVLGMLPLLYPSAKVHSMFTAATVNSYIGFLFAGHYIEKYVKVRGHTALLALITWAGVLVLEVWLTGQYYQNSPNNFLKLDERTYLTIVVQAWCTFFVAKYLFRNLDNNTKLARVICFLGKQTFGVYLLGELGISYLFFVYSTLALDIPRMFAMVIYELAIFAACLLVTIVLRCIPIVRKYI